MRSLRVLALLLCAPAGFAAENVDLAMTTRIRDEAFNHSKVMETLEHLSDAIGPRLTGSPQLKAAADWARQQLESWGLRDARVESWGVFGRPWTLEGVAVRMLTPAPAPLVAIPSAWTPGTNGPVRGRAVRIRVESEDDLAQYLGKLAGAVVFSAPPRDVRGQDKPLLTRFSEKEIDELAQFEVPPARRADRRAAFLKRYALRKKLREFLAEEKALALVEPSSQGDGGTVFVSWGGSWKKGETAGVPALVMAVEHYNRIARLLDRNVAVELELDVRVRFGEEEEPGYNTLAEIPGTDKRDEVVMAGAHLDSWHAGTGATDDGAGVAVVLEAARILRALEAKPRRTIRVALWSGEEQGVYGSKAYVSQHLATRPPVSDPEQLTLPDFLRKPTWPITVKPEHARLSAYFNIDAGTGKIRGIHAQGNAAAVPIFRAWLEPLADLGAKTVTMRDDSGTDHESFDEVGLAGFNFIQDEIEYETRTHHSSMDVFDRIQREDLMQASAVMASFLYDAAMRDEKLPRKPMPQPPPPDGP
jgi:hypothetical protein